MKTTYRVPAGHGNGRSGSLQPLRLFPAIALAAFLSAPAAAHQAPKGWQYDSSCCAGLDCYQAPTADVKETKYGYQLSTGEVIPYTDRRIKRSRDEFFHECKPGGDVNSQHSFCLYVPDHDM
ncbi:MAG: hypothetical protein E5X80_24900 [Mesorhizobium sp.]|uniref:hypothetical protein n=1 Tax=Mesorhizobium sp. TaxID=1871066 RepID=UPI000FE61654|nr:hypothetical protein [Mesorhizobium sp.]RWM07180.1 MAG: hypothetical protein EOR71_17145 [Mesorhizobium sp.]TIO50539.1 MAG: hypothetical protein E5X78_20945 [Mesorhizobium sp.]TIO59263.1 MAG: hypothetical protein E5X79_17570 [Mesorhizobium sp.]TJV59825.1 MAG: hypothetical protein E5X80_24900 [Mesorhizobium sp.]